MKLALGTVQFGLPYGIANQAGQVSLPEGKAILQLAAGSGIDTLDTAMAYGESEGRLGEMGVQGWQIVSKLTAIPEDCTEPRPWMEAAVSSTLQKLNVSSLYGLLLHRPLQLLESNGDQIYRALYEMKQNGTVKKIGVSIYDPSELDALCSHFQFDLVQAPFNILDRRLIDTGWLYRLEGKGIELHARSVFLQGLLLMKHSDRPGKFSRWSSLWSLWDGWLDNTGLTPLEACLRYALSFSEISKVVVGVDGANQLKEILLASERTMPVIPENIQTNDLDLLNPVQWSRF